MTRADTMSRVDKVVNLAGILVPFLGVVLAIVLLWHQAVSATDLAIMAVMYLITAFGITVGYHRLLTHRSFATSTPIEYAFTLAGAMALEGPPVIWVADHRKHHAHSDEEGDPHSPHVGYDGHGSGAVLAGLWHAHAGWLMRTWGTANPEKYAPELAERRPMAVMTQVYGLFLVLSFGIPALAGYLLTGTLAGAATGLLWGGLVRAFLLNHVTFSINSICHFMGRRRFDTDDQSRNVFWLALPSMGESWHHNHHAFPRSAVHGLRRWEVDPSAWLITGLEKVGLAWNVVRIAPERQAAKTTATSSASRPGAAAEGSA